MRQAGATVEGYNVAKDYLFRDNPGVVFQPLDNVFHLREHFGSAELGDDEVVGEESVTKGFDIRFRVVGVWIEEEVKG